MSDNPTPAEPQPRKVSGTVDTDPGYLGIAFWIAAIAGLWTISSELGDIRKELVLLRCYYSAAQGIMCAEGKTDSGKAH